MSHVIHDLYTSVVAAGIPAKKQNEDTEEKIITWIHKSTRSHFLQEKINRLSYQEL